MITICEQATGLDQKQFWRDMNTRINRDRIPFSGSLALTHRCNLRCIHCYTRDGSKGESFHAELTTAQWKRIITEISAAGCLFLVLTGGEPLLRDDFVEIYSFAKRKGFLVTVFTNGNLVKDEVLELFQKMPPRLVELSIYGACRETHDAVTGVPGSFQLTLNTMDRLLGLGIPFGLKTILMNRNIQELKAMEAIAAERKIRFRLDAAIFPTLAGDRSPLELRVTPHEAVAAEFADQERTKAWVDFYQEFRDFPGTNKLYNCGAGRRTFHVDPSGRLFPCLMVREHGYSLLEGDFNSGWKGKVAGISRDVAAPNSACKKCRLKVVCNYCPGFFKLENGDARIPSPYICEIGKLRHQAIQLLQEDKIYEPENPEKKENIS